MKKILRPKAKIIELNIDDIVEYDNNNKIHGKKQIAAIKESIDRFSYVDEIVVDKNNVIILGHGRLEAIKGMGYEKIEVKQLDINSNDEKALRYLHNKLAEYDVEYILENIELEKESGINFTLGGVDFADFDNDLVFQTEETGITSSEPENNYDFDARERRPIQIPVKQMNHYEVQTLLKEADDKGIDVGDLLLILLKNANSGN